MRIVNLPAQTLVIDLMALQGQFDHVVFRSFRGRMKRVSFDHQNGRVKVCTFDAGKQVF